MRLGTTVENNADLGCPSLCCEYALLWLVNKEASVVYGKEENREVGNPSRDAKKEYEVRETPEGVRCQNITSKTLGEHKLIEMG